MRVRGYIIPRGEGFGDRTGDRAGDPAPEPIAGAGTISDDRNRRSRRTSAHIQRPQEHTGAHRSAAAHCTAWNTRISSRTPQERRRALHGTEYHAANRTPQECRRTPERCTLVQIPCTMPERLQSHGSDRRTQARNSLRRSYRTAYN